MSQTLTLQARHLGGMRVQGEARGHVVQADYPTPGHATEAMTSLELLLAALASCALNGWAVMLRREGVSFQELRAQVTAQRRETHPTVLECIHMDLGLVGADCEQAVALQLLRAAEQICPVWAMLRPSVSITCDVRLEAK